ncbi:MAG: hypothetical protein JWN76_3216 [Chitinophagaceae bacterium]|nr:hypothetical protein [Chitinophagaceae bacterium]
MFHDETLNLKHETSNKNVLTFLHNKIKKNENNNERPRI